jgi:hypothetical protein
VPLNDGAVAAQNLDEQRDTSFQQLCNMLGARSVEPLVIQGNDQHPGWTVAEFCDQKIVKSRPPGRSLVLIHYAGHGGYNALAKTLFCYAGPNSKQSFRWDTIHNRVVAPNLGDDVGRLMEHADVLRDEHVPKANPFKL